MFFDRFLISQDKLKQIRLNSSKSFINTYKAVYSESEEKEYIKSVQPMVTNFLNIIHGKTQSDDLNTINKKFIKDGFDFKKVDKNVLKNISFVYENCKELLKKDKKSHENTTVEVFVNVYEALNKPANKSMVMSIYKKYISKFKESVSVLKSLEPNMKFYYLGSLSLISMYVSLFSYLIYTTLILLNYFSLCVATKKKFNIFEFEKENASYTRQCTYNMAIISDYYNSIKQQKLITLLDKSYKGLMNREDFGISKYRYYRSSEDIALVIAVGIVTLLGLKLLLPAIRQFFYFIESIKVDISDLFKDHADMLQMEEVVLKEKIALAKDEREKFRLQEILRKTIEWKNRLLNWAEFWYSEQERTEETTKDRIESDDNNYNDSDWSNEPDSSTTEETDEPEIFL